MEVKHFVLEPVTRGDQPSGGSVKGNRGSGVGIGNVWSSLTVLTRIGIKPKRMIIFWNIRVRLTVL